MHPSDKYELDEDVLSDDKSDRSGKSVSFSDRETEVREYKVNSRIKTTSSSSSSWHQDKSSSNKWKGKVNFYQSKNNDSMNIKDVEVKKQDSSTW